MFRHACICIAMVDLIDIFFFFFNDTATTEIYTLSLHDALPISQGFEEEDVESGDVEPSVDIASSGDKDRKSTRLNSSHANISYAVFCLKKKNTGVRRVGRNVRPTQ